MKYKEIIVQAGAGDSDELHLRGGWDVVEVHCQTILEAKRYARYFLTDTYQSVSECSYPLTYAQVIGDGEVIHDFFRKEPA